MAEEVDNLAKKISIMSSSLDFHVSKGGNSAITNSQQLVQDVQNNKRDIDKFGVDIAQLLLDYNTFKDRATKNLVDQGSSLEMEIMLNRVASTNIEKRID